MIDKLKRRIQMFGMSVQQISPKSAKQWNSFSLVWKLLMQKKVAQSKLLLDRC